MQGFSLIHNYFLYYSENSHILSLFNDLDSSDPRYWSNKKSRIIETFLYLDVYKIKEEIIEKFCLKLLDYDPYSSMNLIPSKYQTQDVCLKHVNVYHSSLDDIKDITMRNLIKLLTNK